jgi:hypothetical protein
MINSQPPTPDIQLEIDLLGFWSLGIGNWDLGVDAAGFSSTSARRAFSRVVERFAEQRDSGPNPAK